jgi:4-hydroxybenzoate polyprenyltransferase
MPSISQNLFFPQSLRFKDWWYLNGLFALGAVSTCFYKLTVGHLFAGLVISFLYLAHGYAMNEYCDQREKPGAKSPEERDLFGAYFLLALNCVLASLFSKDVLILVVLGSVVSWAYSSPPFRFKKRLFLRLFFNSLGFSLLFLLGMLFQNSLSIKGLFLFLFIFLLFIPIELIHVLNDFNDDETNSIVTFPMIFGVKKTIVTISASFMVLAGFSFILYFANFVPVAFVFANVLLALGMLVLMARSYQHAELSLELHRLKIAARALLSIYGAGLFFALVDKSFFLWIH